MIKIDKISKIFTDGTPAVALKDVSLNLPSKGMVFIVGKSGSGKSTLLNILAGYDKPSVGSIEVDGKRLDKFTLHELDYYRNATIGFVFQDYCLIDAFNVYQNIRLVKDYQNKKISKKEIDDILEQVDMKGYGKRFPKQLSAGQKQRIAIARALAKNTNIILADEPTGNLDSKTTVQILNLLKEISKTRLVVIVSHSKEDAYDYADRIIEISNGQIASDKQINPEFGNLVLKNKEAILTNKGKLSEEELTNINKKIRRYRGNVTLLENPPKFISSKNVIDDGIVHPKEKTYMGFKNILKYAWLFFRKHILSFLLVVGIISCLVTTLSISLQFGSYDGSRQTTEAIANSKMKSLIIKKDDLDQDGESVYLNKYRLSDEDVESFKKENVVEFYEMYNIFYPFTSSASSYSSYWTTTGGGGSVIKDSMRELVICDYDYIKYLFGNESGELELLAGSYNEHNDGVIITDFMADSLMVYKKVYKTYNSIIHSKELENNGLVIDAIIKTGYKEKYADFFKNTGTGNEDFIRDNPEIIDALDNEYSILYTVNKNYYEYYTEKNTGDNIKNVSIYDGRYYANNKSFNHSKYYGAYVSPRLNDNEIILAYSYYNYLFDTELEAGDLLDFVPRDVTFVVYDVDGNRIVNNTFKVVGVNTYTYISQNVAIEIQSKTLFKRIGIVLKNEGLDLNKLVVTAKNNEMSFKLSRLLLVDSSVKVIVVFKKFFQLLTAIMIISIVVLIIINSVNTINKNIYNIGVSRAMGAHMSEMGYVYSFQSIVFGMLIISTSTVLDYMSTKILNKIIGTNIIKLIDLPGSDEMTYVFFSPEITSACSGLIVFLTFISILIPIIAIRVMNPVNIIKSRQ